MSARPAAACRPFAARLCVLLVLLWTSAPPWINAAQAAASEPTPEAVLALKFDPSSRQLEGEATWTIPPGMSLTLELDRRFVVDSIVVDGAARAPRTPSSARAQRQAIAIAAQAARAQQWRIRWHGEVAALDRSIDHRAVIGPLSAMASAAGSYLPAGAAWYPEADRPIRYRLTVDLPRGQRAAVPGRLVQEQEQDDAQRSLATYESKLPIEGITLMIGPYRIDESVLTIGARSIRLRTYFTEALQPLASDYLAAAAGYIERFDRSIGAYPFDGFSIVSSPLPTGFGMPGATYVGEAVLRLPFMRGQSLAHEVLHNWWGNGVRVDAAGGNWCEGLTTYLADHALRAEQSSAAARQMRWGWLRDFAAVTTEADMPLTRFIARTHGAASAVGYGKSAMLFHMVRNEIGAQAFDQSLRDLWASHAHRRAGWSDLQAAFERRAGRSLAGLFAPMLTRTGASSATPVSAQWQPGSSGVQMSFAAPMPYTLSLPAIAWHAAVPQPVRIAVRTGERSALLKTAAGRIPDSLQIDPDFDLWRALGPGESPPLLRDVMLGSSTRVMLASPGDEAWRAAAFELASRMLEVAPADLLKQMAAPASERSGTAAGLPGSISLPQGDARPLLIIGLHEDIEPLVRREPALARPSELARLPDAAVWSARSASGGTRVLVSVEDISALIDLHRRAPHYGAQGFIGFRNGKLVTQGIGAIEVRRVQVSR